MTLPFRIIWLLFTLFGQSDLSDKTSKEVVCFVYHRFGDDRYPSTNVTLPTFESHLQFLKVNNYQVLTFDQALDYLDSDTPQQKTAVITIDDGYKSFYENGLPLLKQYGFPASLYINTQTVDGSDYMNWQQIVDAKSNGIEIGNHTHSHDYFLNQPKDERYKSFRQELKKSQRLLKDNLGTEPSTFAYPFGELDEKMKREVRKMGFKGALAQNSGVISGSTDLMRCPRFPMSEQFADLDKFASKATMHAFTVASERPSSFVLQRNKSQPILEIVVANESIQINTLNCYIQGSECTITTEPVGKDKTRITAQAKSAISERRRTLYTITGQNDDGSWNWFSHLWINPEIGE